MAKKEEKTPRPRRKFVRRATGELFDTRGIAVAVNESEFTIRNWRYKGVIPFIRLGYRSVRYRLPDVLAAIEKFTIKTK